MALIYILGIKNPEGGTVVEHGETAYTNYKEVLKAKYGYIETGVAKEHELSIIHMELV